MQPSLNGCTSPPLLPPSLQYGPAAHLEHDLHKEEHGEGGHGEDKH